MSPTVQLVQICTEAACVFICLEAFFIIIAGSKEHTASGLSIARMFLFNTILLTADAVAYVFRGGVSTFAYYAVRISNFAVFVFQFILLYESLIYFSSLLKEQGTVLPGIFLRLQRICMGIGILATVISQFTGFVYYIDESNIYHRQGGIVLTMGLGFVGLLINLALLLYCRKSLIRKQWIVLMLFTLMPAFSVILQMLLYGLSLINITNTAMLIVALFIGEVERARRMQQQAMDLVKQREKLTEQRIQLITSQIRPHFLYNALATIGTLCQTEPATAELAVNRFSEYLRMNLDTMDNQTMIPFSKELEHSKTYLWLENLRFGDILKVEYDIEVTDFLIPPLSLQPFVENAVKHGIFPLEDGGTVKISSRRTDEGIEIVVSDDGAGFDMSVPPDGSRSHIGISNVKNRIRALCGGSVHVSSAPGEGCTVTITLPDGGDEA